jgi:hypothetical protein
VDERGFGESLHLTQSPDFPNFSIPYVYFEFWGWKRKGRGGD